MKNQRLYFLDWLRILAFALLVLYHVGMVYVSWDFHVKSPFAGTALEPWMKLSGPWRMSLLFFVSGAATAFLFAREGASGALLRSRAKRLLLPLVFGMLVIVPPQSYVEVVQKYGYAGGFFDFMRLYLGAYGGFCEAPGRCLILPTWNHLWFLPYLMAYTALLWGVLRRWPRALDTLAQGISVRGHGVHLLWIPVLWLVATRLVLRPWFPVTHAFFDDPFAHAQFIAVFMAGAAFARAAVWHRFEGLRWVALAAAAIGYAGIVTPGMPDALRLVAVSTMQWCAVVAAVGFAHRHLNRDGSWRRALTEAVFPVYLLHQTVIVLMVAWLAVWQLAPMVEGPLIAAVTFVACAAGYRIVRRIGGLRPWFGLGPQPSAPGTDTIHDTPKRSVTMP